MEKKVNIRALMQVRLNALKERKAVKTIKKSELSPRMQEFIEGVKSKLKERGIFAQKGAMKPSELKERALAKRNELKSIIEKRQKLNKKEVNHD